jgi:hypothetical protein
MGAPRAIVAGVTPHFCGWLKPIIQNEELASSVPISGPPSPCSWHEPIPQWVVVPQISPQRFEEFLLEGFVVPQFCPQRLNAK